MEGKQFARWLKLVFLKNVSHLDWSKILFLDGHSSHITSDLIQIARENQVILFRLPAHTSHLIQPLDVSVFKTTKELWQKILQAHLVETGWQNISKDEFSRLLKKLVEKGGFKRSNAVIGFEESCIFPLCRDKIDCCKMAIGSVFRNDNLPLSQLKVSVTDVDSYPSTGSPISRTPCQREYRFSPYTVTSPCVHQEQVLQSVTNVLKENTKEVGLNITTAVLNVLQKQYGRKTEHGPNRVLKYSTDYMMTSDIAFQQIAQLENEQMQKVIFSFQFFTL